MAKELPYYKHEPSEWLEGEIQACSDSAIVCFTNLRDGYWLKLGCISYAFALHKYCRKDANVIKELIDNGIIDLEGDEIRIRFLDKQLKEFNSVSEKRKDAANKRWGSDANAYPNALQVESKSNAIREDKSKEEEIKEDKSILLKKETKKPSKKNSLVVDNPTTPEFIFLKIFNDCKERIRGELKKPHKMLTLADQKNLKKLLDAGITWDEVQYAVEAMLCADYPKANALDHPAHVLRNENFLKYLHVENLNQLKNDKSKPDRDQQAIDYLTRPR